MKRRMGRRRLALLPVLLAVWAGAGPSPTGSGIARAVATYYVNGNAGSDSATCSQASPCLTIGHAITVAGSGDAISIAGVGGSFNGIYCEQLIIDKTLTLQATSPSNPPAIDGGAGSGNSCGTVNSDIPGDSVVRIGDSGANAVTVTLQKLTIQHGDASNNPTDSSNYNGPGKGGGIFVYPHAVLVGQSITVSGNTACSACSIIPNPGYGYGGGIYNNFGAVTLTSSTVSSNAACAASCSLGFGGGIYGHGGTTSLANSTLSGNSVCGGSCTGGEGGGIYGGGATTVTNSTISGNSVCSTGSCPSGSLGGEIFIDASTTTLSNSTVTANTTCSTSCADATGGGIENQGGTITVTSSAVTSNIACNGSCSSGSGGGIASSGTTTVTNSTVSGNTACSTTCHNGEGGGVNSSGVSFTISNTILAGNGGAADSPDCSGSLTDGTPNGTSAVGDNILGDGTGCTFTPGNGDQVGTGSSMIDPRLGSLQNNGGPTQTMAPGPTSPAIGAGDPATCQSSSGGSAVNNLDQRGISRRADVRLSCDIGAHDTGGAIALTKGWNLISLPLQSSGTGSAAVLVSSVNGRLGGGTITTLATYSHGAFHLYVAGYTADQPLMASQGIFVLSNKVGQWLAPGTAYTSGQPVNLQAGWNLISAPSPYRGLNGDDIKGGIGATGAAGCGLKEVAVFSGGSYQVYTPSNGPAGAAFHVSNLLGMFLQCANAFSWTPS